MAKQHVHVKKTTKRRVRKVGGKTGLKRCPNCGGDGVVRVRKK